MGCFPCFGSRKKDVNPITNKNESSNKEGQSIASSASHLSRVSSERLKSKPSVDGKKEASVATKDGPTTHIAAQTFTFRELATATNNFRPECLLGEGGFGRVYKGRLETTGQVVAVKQLDRNGLQGNREFLVEVLMLSLLHHPNLVNLIGYCADGDQRLLVYEYMPLGSLEDHLHDLPPDKEPLDWNTRMKIAAGAARGLEYLHDKANPPVIYRDFKSSNILLDEGFHPKLSDFGLAKLGPVGDKTHVSTRVMGTYGYCAPEYAMTGQLTLKSDVYSFGVVFLELITGRKAIDNSRSAGEHNLVAWARPLFRDRRKFPKMADPLLQGRYPMRGLYQALAVAAMCLQEQAATRPLIGDVVTALSYLASQTYDPGVLPAHSSRNSAHTPREKDEKRSGDAIEDEDEVGHRDRGNKHGGLQSPSPNSPDFRQKDTGRQRPGFGSEIAKGQEGVGSGRRWDLDDWEKQEGQRDSPGHVGKAREGQKNINRDRDRERAVFDLRVSPAVEIMCLSMDIFEAMESYSEWAAFLRRLNFELSRNVTRNWAAVKIQSFFRGFILRRSSPLHNLKFIAKIMKSLQSIPPLPNDDERSKLTEEFKDYLLQLHAIQENNVSVLREAKDAAVMDIFMLMPRDILDDIIEQLRIFPRRKAAFHECLLLNPSAEDEMGIHGGQNSANSHASNETLENENGKFGYAEDEKDVGVNYEGAVALIEDYFVGEKVNDNGQDDEWVMIPTMDEVESA